MTFFLLLSVACYRKKQDLAAGSLMALAISTKFIPIVMVPFLALSRKGIRWSFAISLIVSLALIFGVAYWLLGDQVFFPFQKAAGRDSKLLSIFRFLRGSYSPLRLFAEKPNVDGMSVYCALGALGALSVLHIRYRLDSILAAFVALCVLLMLYKVSHPQFFITPIMLITLWIASDFKVIKDSELSLVPVFLFITWISLVAFLYMLTNGYSRTGWREIVGLPTFLATGWMLTSIAPLLVRRDDD